MVSSVSSCQSFFGGDSSRFLVRNIPLVFGVHFPKKSCSIIPLFQQRVMMLCNIFSFLFPPVVAIIRLSYILGMIDSPPGLLEDKSSRRFVLYSHLARGVMELFFYNKILNILDLAISFVKYISQITLEKDLQNRVIKILKVYPQALFQLSKGMFRAIQQSLLRYQSKVRA